MDFITYNATYFTLLCRWRHTTFQTISNFVITLLKSTQENANPF